MIHFKEEEFKGWLNQYSVELLVKLDFLREILDESITLSNSSFAYGRHGGESYSQHNIDRWEEVRAVDGYIPEGVSYKEFYEAARAAQFRGIGLYKGWPSGRRGFHVDVRQDRTPEVPALWAARWSNGKNIYDLNFHELINN